MTPRRILLDQAATSFPKPEAVYQAVDAYQRRWGAPVGRSATRVAGEVQRTVDRCRGLAARLFGAHRPEQAIFTYSGTDALNLAIHGLVRPGDRVVTTVWEHNSVLRPLKMLEQTRSAQVEIVRHDGSGRTDLEAWTAAWRAPARLAIINHASNVTGVIQPALELAQIARAAGALVLLDAAQTAGHIPVQLEDLGVDLIASPGHKGLLGPLGTGLLILRAGMEAELQPVRQGGTGTVSESDEQPSLPPDRYESGNHNAPGLFGLEAALSWLQEQKSDFTAELARRLIDGLRLLPGMDVMCADPALPRVGVVSLRMDRLTPQVLAALLDEHFGIETRAGLHCAPRAHAALGTLADGGTLRLSLGRFTTADDIDQTLEALGQIAVST